MRFNSFLLLALLTLLSFSVAFNVLAGATGVGQGTPPAGTVQLTNPLTGTTGSEGIPKLLGRVINAVLGIVGSLALVMFIYGGITWMLSSGNAERVGKGKNILIWATVGLVVIFSAYAIINFIFTGLKG